jgi:hypothetical protein
VAATTRLVNASTFKGINPALWKELIPCKCGYNKLHLINQTMGDTPTLKVKCIRCRQSGPIAESVIDAVSRWNMLHLII